MLTMRAVYHAAEAKAVGIVVVHPAHPRDALLAACSAADVRLPWRRWCTRTHVRCCVSVARLPRVKSAA